MKPDWDRLGDDFAGSKTVVIADVDCTVHQDLCGSVYSYVRLLDANFHLVHRSGR